MYSAMSVVGTVAAGKYMIQTGLSARSRLPGVDVAVNPKRLTWRTARLARSLTNQNSPDAVHKVRVAGAQVIGEKGTTVEYAAIHEFGGTISHPGGTAYIVTGDGARFISNAKAARFKNQKSVRRTRAHSISIPARPFLAPAVEDSRERVANIFAKELAGFISENVVRTDND
jgi:phage gpG-like protein